MIVSEPKLIAALAKIDSSSALLAQATYDAVRTESMKKHVKALKMKAHNDKPVNAQEREAYASVEYLAALEAEAHAAGELAKIKSELEAARLIVDVWRTEESSARAATR